MLPAFLHLVWFSGFQKRGKKQLWHYSEPGSVLSCLPALSPARLSCGNKAPKSQGLTNANVCFPLCSVFRTGCDWQLKLCFSSRIHSRAIPPTPKSGTCRFNRKEDVESAAWPCQSPLSVTCHLPDVPLAQSGLNTVLAGLGCEGLIALPRGLCSSGHSRLHV